MNTLNEAYYMHRCLRLIEEKMQWGNSAEWVNTDYQNLSDVIQKHTRILISSHTLKRLFGKIKVQNEHYNPQIETKNALALFVGYQSWHEFKASFPTPIVNSTFHTDESIPAHPESPDSTGQARAKERVKPRIFLSLILCCGTLAAGFWYWRVSQIPAGQLTSKYSKGHVPITPVFTYKATRAKDLRLDMGNGFIRTLPKGSTTVTYCYQIPGIYRIRLLSGDKVLAATNVYATTQGWENTVILDNFKEYAALHEPVADTGGRMYLSPQQIAAKGHDVKQRYTLQYANIRSFSLDGDNFSMETRVRNNATEGGVSCYDIIPEVLGREGNIRLQFLEPGCSMWVRLQFGDVLQNGEFADLTAFGQDISDWRTIRVVMKDFTARVFFENRLIYTARYQKSIGDIEGLSFRFRGSGSVDYVKLFDKEQKLVYKEDF